MKHIKNLAYAVIQWHLKEMLIIWFLLAGVGTALSPHRWYIIVPCTFILSFAEAMATRHRRDKTLKK